MKATDEQLKAIASRGKILVSASAGAGKTTVMIKRLADIVQGGADLDSVLAVTFTKKAAAQMKAKLREELIARLDCDDEQRREYLRTQLGKVGAADISTIHSFCARLVRTYFYALGVDSSFEMLSDGAEQSALMQKVADELFDGLYKSEDEDFYFLLSTLRRKRSDAYLKKVLFAAYGEVRVRYGYAEFLKESQQATYSAEGFERVAARLQEELADRCRSLLAAVEQFERDNVPPMHAEEYGAVLREMKSALVCVAEGDLFSKDGKLTLPKKPNVCDGTRAYDEEFVKFRDYVKKKYESLFAAIADRDTERERFESSGRLCRAFNKLLLAFDGAYSAAKREEGKLDYGDLEHYACRLLVDGGCDADVCEQIRAKYKYVFVDEYQDVNPIQDKLIGAIAAEDEFCVGDVKQAIYGFRGSRSAFFGEKSKGRSGDDYIILPDNFRSSPKVIDFVNSVFSGIMTRELCPFDYSEGHAMRGGDRYVRECGGVAELCIYTPSPKQKLKAEGVYSLAEQSLKEREMTDEGRAILYLVQEALKSYWYDPDAGLEKRVQTGDICILTRKRSSKSVQGIMRAISSLYPVSGAAETNACDRPEIKQLLGILSYISNSQQDIPLVTALLSPLGGVTNSELTRIRAFGGTGKGAPAFRECAARYAQNSRDDLAEKLNAFFARMHRLHALSGCIGAAKLIDEIMRIGALSSSFDTQDKLTALRRLQREAYTPTGELPLNALLAKIKRSGNRLPMPSSLSTDCIKVMTMHASKGLEFPVVIVADVASAFKGEDGDEMPFDDEFGFAPRYFSGDRSYCDTLLRKYIRLREGAEELSNEINLFYVACTRAKYALYVLSGKADAYKRAGVRWAESYAQLFDVNAVKGFATRILPAQPPIEGEERGEVVVDASQADGEMLTKLREVAFYQYGYELGTELPVKSSASRLVALRGEEDPYEVLFDEREGERGEDGAPSAAEVGTAYHRFLELCDFSVRDPQAIREQLVRWELDGSVTPEQRALLDVEKLVKILSLPAFENAVGKQTYREREFICRLPSCDYVKLKSGVCGEGYGVGEDDGNGVIVQGAIDLLCVERRDGRAVSARITDYKYSVHGGDVLREKYAPQLALYKSVVCKIYSLPPSAVSCGIVNIRTLRSVDMPV